MTVSERAAREMDDWYDERRREIARIFAPLKRHDPAFAEEMRAAWEAALTRVFVAMWRELESSPAENVLIFPKPWRGKRPAGG